MTDSLAAQISNDDGDVQQATDEREEEDTLESPEGKLRACLYLL